MATCKQRMGVLHPDGWNGDLRDFSMTASSEPGELAAVVVVSGGRADGWMNLRHCHREHWAPVWMRLRSLAARTPPLGIIYARDLAALATGEQSREA